MVAYGPLAHGLLSGGLHQDTRFADGDWRASSADFHGDVYRRNLAAVAGLERLARDELGVSVSQLAVAWTLANPAVDVAIVGTRNPAHVHDAVAATDVKLEPDILKRIDEIMSDTQPIAGLRPQRRCPNPESDASGSGGDDLLGGVALHQRGQGAAHDLGLVHFGQRFDFL